MTWAKQDDGAESNPRVLRLEQGAFMVKALGYGEPALQRGAAWGFLTLLASWSGRHFTDLHFPEVMVRRVAGPHAVWFVACAQSAGLLSRKKVKGKDGDVGWQFVDNGDELLNVLTKEQVIANANRNAARRHGLKVAVRLRDGDLCRYCGRPVRFDARNGWMAGKYLPAPPDARHLDHVDPEVPDRLVVACGQCNQAKGKQTPQEWGRPLLPIPDQPLYNADTLELFRRHEILDPFADRDRVLAWLGDGSSSDLVPEPEPSRERHVPMPVPSRSGPGRAPVRDGPDRGVVPGQGQPVPVQRDDEGNVRRLPVRDDNGTPEAG